MNETDGAITKLIERFLAIGANDDYERFGELLTDDCTFTLMPIGHTWSGRDNVMNAVVAAGRSRTHDSRSKVDITNWFTNDEYLVVEYEHAALIGGVRVKIDGYCLVFHIRDERFDSMREYINPSNPATSILLSLVLRAYPFLARWRARSAAAS
ncbi:MAG: nuclear transport factor 2 family protein [Mycobacterium sp.]